MPESGENFWGLTPTEEEYYRSHGVKGAQSFYTTPRGLRLFTRSWEPFSGPPIGVICMVHGYGNDTSWTFQSTPIFLASHGFSCFALDLPSHGRSDGLRAFVPDVPVVVSDLQSFFNLILDLPEYRLLPRFLFGESMGAAICLLLHLNGSFDWDGAVLVAPMCRISDDIRPPWPVPEILTAVARFFPTLPVVPTGDIVEKSVKVKEKREIAWRNPMRYNGKPRLGTVVELLRVTDHLHARLAEVRLPFILLHGTADAVTDPEVSRELHRAAASKDKIIKLYDGMMHSLLFGETDENVEIVRRDILEWLRNRLHGRIEVAANTEVPIS